MTGSEASTACVVACSGGEGAGELCSAGPWPLRGLAPSASGAGAAGAGLPEGAEGAPALPSASVAAPAGSAAGGSAAGGSAASKAAGSPSAASGCCCGGAGAGGSGCCAALERRRLRCGAGSASPAAAASGSVSPPSAALRLRPRWAGCLAGRSPSAAAPRVRLRGSLLRGWAGLSSEPPSPASGLALGLRAREGGAGMSMCTCRGRGGGTGAGGAIGAAGPAGAGRRGRTRTAQGLAVFPSLQRCHGSSAAAAAGQACKAVPAPALTPWRCRSKASRIASYFFLVWKDRLVMEAGGLKWRPTSAHSLPLETWRGKRGGAVGRGL